jgi:hypothetical protein
MTTSDNLTLIQARAAIKRLYDELHSSMPCTLIDAILLYNLVKQSQHHVAQLQQQLEQLRPYGNSTCLN